MHGDLTLLALLRLAVDAWPGSVGAVVTSSGGVRRVPVSVGVRREDLVEVGDFAARWLPSVPTTTARGLREVPAEAGLLAGYGATTSVAARIPVESGGAAVVLLGPGVAPTSVAGALDGLAFHMASRLAALETGDEVAVERDRRLAAENRYRNLVQASPSAVLVFRVDDTRIVFANPLAVELFGASSLEDLLAAAGKDLVAPELIRDIPAANRNNPEILRRSASKVSRLDGEEVDADVCASAVEVGGALCVQLELRETTTRGPAARREHAHAIREVRTDALTRAKNRHGWALALPAHLQLSAATGEPVTVCLCDIDDFSSFNAANSRESGDALLRELYSAWRRRLRPSDTVARVSGDEFAIAVTACSADSAVLRCNDLRTHVPRRATVSIGVAEWDGEESAEDLLGRAQRALDAARAAGGDQVVIDDSGSDRENPPGLAQSAVGAA